MRSVLDWYRSMCVGGLWLLLMMPVATIAQEEQYIAIIPTFHDKNVASGTESALHLNHILFTVFVYRDAVAVYSEAEFVNTGMDTLSQEFALPSTGHDENGDQPGGRISSGILSVRLWMDEGREVADLIHDADEDQYAIRSRFEPGEHRKVKAVFWAQTSLDDVDSLPGLDTIAILRGKRGFMLDIVHAAVWNDVIDSIDVSVLIKDGMTVQRDSFTVEPSAYDQEDSILVWSFTNLEPTLGDNVEVSYLPAGNREPTTNTMAKLSAYIVGDVYDDLLHYIHQMEEE